MTAVDHRSDWKVTPGYRVLLAVGWGALVLALYVAVVAMMLGLPVAWWISGGLSLTAIAAATFLPEPVPAEMIVGGRNHIGPQQGH